MGRKIGVIGRYVSYSIPFSALLSAFSEAKEVIYSLPVVCEAMLEEDHWTGTSHILKEEVR